MKTCLIIEKLLRIYFLFTAWNEVCVRVRTRYSTWSCARHIS